ncbi:MAG: hypothetical protein ACTS8S_22105 [Giesbergeria sp.]
MFVLPALILPLVFGLAVFRLYQIPRKLWVGALRLPDQHRQFWLAAAVGAYLVLLCYTVALISALGLAFFAAENQISVYLSLLIYVAVYPVVYFAAAWVFYHGLKPDLR